MAVPGVRPQKLHCICCKVSLSVVVSCVVFRGHAYLNRTWRAINLNVPLVGPRGS